MGFVDNSQGNSESQVLKIPDLFAELDYFREKVNLELEIVTPSCPCPGVLYGKNPPAYSKIPLLNLSRPVIKDLLSVQFCSERISICFQLLAFNMISPAFPEDILNPPHVSCELPVGLLGPYD